MTVAPSSRTTWASGAATAPTASAEPTAAIRPSRTSMHRAGSASAIVTTAAPETISSICLPPSLSIERRPRDDEHVLQGILPVERSRALPDALAGLTLAALGIPEVLGYAKIAGMPVVTDLLGVGDQPG